MIAIDPGRCSGFAIFLRNKLIKAGVMKDTDSPPTMSAWVLTQVVIEIPRIYPHGKGKGDPNDLISLALQVGDLRGYYTRRGFAVELVEPRRWKGTVPKAIHGLRVLEALTARERAILPKLPKTKAHNMIDAVGLGLWWLKKEGMRT